MGKIIFTDEQLKQLGALKKPQPVKPTYDDRIIKIGRSKNGKGYMVANRTAIFEKQVKTIIYLLENKIGIKELRSALDSIERVNLGVGFENV
jgi:hypothetical protein